MSISALMEEMAAKGASLEVILMAVRAVEAEQRNIAEQRSKAAERKRRQRDRERDCHATVTGLSGDMARQTPALSPSPNEILNPNPTPTPVEISHAREAASDFSTVAKLGAAQIAIGLVISGLRSRRWKDTPPPDGVSDEQWRGFLEHRKAKRQSLTYRAHQLLCRKLTLLAEDGWPPGEMIDLAVERGWITVFAPRDQLNGQRTHHDRPSGWAPAPGLAGFEPASLDD